MDAAAWSVVVAVVALVVSVFAWVASRWRDRRDLFLRVHERLASVELQQGRRLIHKLLRDRKTAVSKLDPEQYDLINHTLSNLNVACFYYSRRYVSREDMLDQWGEALGAVCRSAQPFLAYRDSENNGVPIWPELRAFAADTEKHKCNCDEWWRRWTRFLG